MASTNNNTSQSGFARVVSLHEGLIRFYFVAAFIFGGFLLFYSQYLVETEMFERYLEACASAASWFLNTVLGESSYLLNTTAGVKSQIQVDDGAFVVVTQGCDASTVFAVLIATIIGWPGNSLKKILVALIGTAVMFALNVLRIAAMLLADIYMPLHFSFINEWILPGALVLAALVYFYLWIVISGVHPSDA